MSDLTIHIFTILKNEEKLLPYFLRHYETFADKIFIFNDHSTDRTVEIAKSNPKVVLMDFPYNNGLNEDDFSECFQTSYKKYSRGIADWVMCVDGDEFIYHPDIKTRLRQLKDGGRQLIRARGFDMVSDVFPTIDGQIYDECKMGYYNSLYSKMVIIDPSLDVKFTQGRHKINPIDGVNMSKTDILLLHYKYLSQEYYMDKYGKSMMTRGLSDGKAADKITTGLERFSKTKLEKII